MQELCHFMCLTAADRGASERSACRSRRRGVTMMSSDVVMVLRSSNIRQTAGGDSEAKNG